MTAHRPSTAIATLTGYTPLTAQRTTATTYDTTPATYTVMGRSAGLEYSGAEKGIDVIPAVFELTAGFADLSYSGDAAEGGWGVIRRRRRM